MRWVDIAKKYGVNVSTVTKIMQGKLWQWDDYNPLENIELEKERWEMYKQAREWIKRVTA